MLEIINEESIKDAYISKTGYKSMVWENVL